MKVKRHIRGLLAHLLSPPRRWRRPLALVAFFVIAASGFALACTNAGERFASFTWPESLSRIFSNRSPRTMTPIVRAGTTYTWNQTVQNISGTLFDSAGLPLSGRTIRLLQNGTIALSATTNLSGDYSFTGVTLASGDKIVVYISGALEKGATVTLSGAADITNLNIRQNVLIVRTDSGVAITNSNLRDAAGDSPDPDLTAVRSLDPANVLTVPAGKTLEIWTGSTYAPGADINEMGNWSNNGTFVPETHTVAFNGMSNQTIAGSSSSTFNNLTISNTGTSPDNVVSLDGNAGATNTIASQLTITGGVFDQGVDSASSDLRLAGGGQCVVVRPGATWRNRGRGDETLSCDVHNEGTIEFNAVRQECGDADEILIRSSLPGTQRTWEGTGTFSMTDVDVQDQRVPGGSTLPLQILVNSGTNSGNNTGWTFPFIDNCTGPYTWIGGDGQRWADDLNWSPIRTDANNLTTTDVLIFDGNVTPAPVVEDVQSQTNSAIRLQNGVDLTLHANIGGSTLTLAGATGNDLDVPALSRLTLAGVQPLIIELTAPTLSGSAPAGHVAGQIIMKDDKHQLIGDNAGEIIFTGANALTIDPTYSAITHPFGSGTSGSVVFQSGSTGLFSSGLDPFGGVGRSVVTFNAGSTAHFRSNGAFFGDTGATYGNLILDGTQGYTFAGSTPTTILNNLEIEPGSTFLLSSSPGADLNLYGNFVDKTTLANGFSPNQRVVKFLGATQTVSKAAGGIVGFAAVLINQSPGGKVLLLSPTDIAQLNLSTANALLELNGQVLELIGAVIGPGNLKGDPNAILAITGSGDVGTVNFVSGGRNLSGLIVNRDTNGSMTLGTDLAVAGTLKLDNGILNTGATTLSLAANSAVERTNGYVVGNLQKAFGPSGNLGSFTFPLGTANAYSPLDANVTANTNGTLTVKAVQGQQPNIPGGANALQRYWTLSGSGITADLTFHYSTSPTNDVVGNESNYKIFKYDGSFTQFTPDATGVNSAGDHFATLNNVSSFSDWTLGEPTAVNPGSVAFVGAPYTTAEGSADHDVTITVARSGGSDGALDVTYATSAGTATAGTDYVETTNTLHWNAGESGNKTFVITVKGDSDYEPNETVNITLSNPTDGATITLPSATTLTIANDDNPAANATFTVNTTDDLDNGACLTAHCSLREAINAANLLPDANTINFNIAGGDPGCIGGVCTINLTSVLPDLTSDMTINGSGAATLTLQRSTAPATPEFRIFTINGNVPVAVSDLTISNGKINDASLSRGGGIFIGNGSLTLTGVAVGGNSVGGPVSAKGGGIYNELGTLTIINSTISNNSASAAGENDGGGIYNSSTLTIINSTVSGNSVSSGSTGVGGGIYSNGASSLTNGTVSNNSASGSGLNQGGGINNVTGSMNARNTIISGNTCSTGPDFNGALTSLGHNLIGNTSGATVTPQTGDKFDAAASPLNLGPLANNGGPTQTMALGSGSVAIDGGDDCVVDSAHCGDANLPQLTTDQRGTGFPRQVDGNNDGTAQVDIGAYEAPTCTPPATPTASNDGPYCEGATIQLATPTVIGATYAWTGPNGFTSNQQKPSRANATVVDGGTYSVIITVNGCASAAGSTNVVVNPAPATPTASNGGPYCEGATISLSTPTVAGATYSWTGPNGFISSLQNPTRPNATTADAGTYSVTITINGCASGAGSTNVVVNATPATPVASNGGPYCEGATIQLSTPTVAGATYSWTGPNGFTSSAQNPTRANATTADAGTYSVTITVNGCASAAGSTNVVVNATPATPTASNGGPYCEGATIQLSTPTVSGATYSWTGPNGFSSSIQNPTRANATTADAGTYSVTITINGCASGAGSTNVVVNATPATPVASNGGPYCEGGTISLSTPTVAGATYSWTGPNGFTSSAQNPTRTNATTADAGTYSLTITVNGCSSAAGSTNVVVNATPATPVASNGGPYFEGATIQLSTPTIAGATYSWTGPNSFTSSLQNPTRANATTADAGIYSVTITVNGCTSAAGTTNVVVNANAAPTITDPGPLNLDPNSSAQFDIFANDADLGQSLSFSVVVGDVSCPDPPAGKFSSISFSGTMQLSANPNNWKSVLTINSLAGSQGSYTQKIQVTDGVTPTTRCLSITVAAPDTDVALTGGNLVISDVNGGNTDDAITLSLNGSNVRINDPNHVLSCGGGVSIDTHTCEVPLSSITGSIQVDMAGGNDTLTLALGGGNFIPQPGGVIYNGGDPTSAPGDQLIITGGNQGTVTYNYTNVHDGSVDMSNFGKVTYTGLEPISNTGTASDIIFELPPGANDATLADDGTAGNAISRLSGATFETTDFANPTGSLTIKRGNAADTLAVNALPDFSANLTIGSAGNEFSTVTFNGAITLAPNNSLAANASGPITLSNSGNALTTSGAGTISLTAANVTGAGNVSTGGGMTVSNTGSSSTLSGVIAGTGGLTKLGAGSLVLSGANTYTSATAVNAGRLNIDGSIDSNMTVNSGATLGGTGTINSARTLTVTSAGVVAPGTSPGILNTGNVTFNSSSSLAVEIGGTTPGNGPTNHDQLNVTGTVSLGNAVLGLSSFSGFVPSAGQSFVIISNDGNDGVTGTFNGLGEGATIPNFLGSSLNATITYQGGTNSNDVVLTVGAGPATHFLVSAPATATAGSAFSFTVTALDQFNNTAMGYAGTVHFTSTDGAATLPANSTLTNGTGTFSATLKTAGNQTLTATDTVTSSITGTSNTIAVSAGSATHFSVSAPASATAGAAFSFTVTALDQFNNTAMGYAGTVHFTSSDGQAVLPANSTLISGTGTFSATLKTAGNQTLTATDTVTSSIIGTSGTIAVSAGSTTHFSVSAPASATAGSAFSFTVTAQDQFNNTATSYAGTVHFTSTDGSAVLPANSTLTNGIGTFSATLKTAGNQTLTAMDTVTSSITGNSNTIAVSAGSGTHFTVSAPASATAGSAFSFTVTAQDQFNNTATGYAGTVHFTSTDGSAVLPANSTLTSGTGTFSATLKTAGNQTLTATDTVTSSITGTSNTIAVSAGSATHFSVSAPASATAGSAFSFTMTALDQFNNTATSYAGTVHFTSSDGSAVLPANSTLTNGVGTFSATLNTGGNQTITATDTVNSSITGTSNPILVGNPPMLVLDAKSAEPLSGTAQMLFAVNLSTPTDQTITVDYATAVGGANPATVGTCGNAGVDYQATSGTLTFNTGDQIKLITVTICAGAANEPDETLLLNLTNYSNLLRAQATGTILANSQPGTILISELRTSGPAGAGDDFVEIYNNSDSPHTVDDGSGIMDASHGYGLYKMSADCSATPVLIGVIPNGTVIPERGHYLFVGSAYSLANYGGTGAAAGDQTLLSDIESDRNVALFSTATVTDISSANRLDAVGFASNTGGVCDLLREGTTLSPMVGSVLEYSFFRDECGKKGDPALFGPCSTGGFVKDSNINAEDLVFTDTSDAVTIAGQRLGAPGPQNLASPTLHNSSISALPSDSTVAATAAPNRVRDLAAVQPNAANGTLTIRRRFVNNTGAPVTRLRFRIMDISSAFVPPGPIADLRALTSGAITVNGIGDSATCLAANGVAATPCTITVQGTTLETPPAQPLGGGLNSSMSAGTITLATPLAAGASINLQFLLGVQQPGSFKFFINIEALGGGAPAAPTTTPIIKTSVTKPKSR